jgi:nucleotide-binding universal stress UspA family protein
MYQKILIAIEDKTSSELVFREGLALAKATGASLMLVRVLSPQDEDAPLSPVAEHIYDLDNPEGLKDYLRQWKIYEQAGTDLLKNLETQASAAGISTEFSLNRGEPGQVICNLAQNWQADLILVAGRERRGLLGLFQGSVSNYVTHHAHCSVLVVHNQAE